MNFCSVDPATESVIAEFPAHSPHDVNRIILLATESQRRWAKLTLAERSVVVRRIGDILEERCEQGAHLITSEMGKPLPQARAEIEKSALACRTMVDIAPQALSEEIVDAGFTQSRIHYEPLGLVLSIMPWNFPFWQFFRFAAPALLAGNGILLKHAPTTMGCARAIEDICVAAGVPDGLVRALVIDVPDVESVIADDRIAAVTFTGSTRAGRAVAECAGRYLKPIVLELGGSDAYIILDDADLDRAVAACATGRLLNTGQSCIAAKRFLVHERWHDAFIEQMAKRFDDALVGSPLESATEIGPIAREDLRDLLLDQVRCAIEAGATLRTRRTRDDVPERGWFVPPMLLADVQPSNPGFREELFGPVATVTRFQSDEEAIRLANDSVYGLGGAVFSQDMERAQRIASELHVGTVFINDFVRSHVLLPFGGVKQSGYGRELGTWGIREFVNVKNVTIG